MNYRTGKRFLTVGICLYMLGSFCSCDALTGLADKLGFDTYDYLSETVHTIHETDSTLAAELTDMIRILTPALVEFDSMGEAIPAYRDQVLTHMLETEYARYSGNITLIEETARAYPEYQVTQIIPASDFEATMYRYFGGTVKISHKDGNLFRYLKKVEAYISPTAPAPDTSEIRILSLSETDKTYQVYFNVTQGETVSDTYFVLIIKREDGTLYFKQLSREIPSAAEAESDPET